MKKPKSVMEYPIVVRKVLGTLTISAPDLGIFVTLPAPPRKETNKGYVTDLSPEYCEQIGRRVREVWVKVDRHIQEKKWVPDASDIREVMKKADRDLTLPAFRKIIAKVVSVSEDTIRRDCDREIIQSYRTSGGHRRIPASEVAVYFAHLEGRMKEVAPEMEAIRKVMEKRDRPKDVEL